MENSIRVLASSLVAVGVYALYKFLFHKPSLKEYEDPYKEPGFGFTVKYTLFWIRELMFRKHLKRFNVIDMHGNTAADIGVYPNELHEQLENPQIVDIPDDMDETGFMGVNLTSGEVLNVSLAKRPNNYGEAVIHFYSPSLNGKEMEFELPIMPKTLVRNKMDDKYSWTCGDLKIWCHRPLTRWRISFNGLLRWVVYSRVIDHLEDTSANALARALALSQSSNPREDIDKLLNQYDEWGTLYGSITVDSSPETELLLFGCKTRKNSSHLGSFFPYCVVHSANFLNRVSSIMIEKFESHFPLFSNFINLQLHYRYCVEGLNPILSEKMNNSRACLQFPPLQFDLLNFNLTFTKYVNPCAYICVFTCLARATTCEKYHMSDTLFATCKTGIMLSKKIHDGSSISFNAINMPNRLPEMIWGYVELGNGFRHLIQYSDFELLRFKEYDSAPKVLSIRFKAGDDHYILDIGCCSGNFDHLWGSNQDLKFNCNNVSICLTSVYHDLRLHGKGMISFASQNDLELEPNLSLPPFISEPDVNESELNSVNILKLSDDFCKSSKLVGGKGSSLAMLRQINSDFNVPDGLCITVSANYEHIKRNGSIAQQIEMIENICWLYKLFEETRLSEELADELRAKLSESFEEDFEKIKFAVRSSALGMYY
ncbi:hypothetical protein GQR58_027096 [Nymphon striatum]|nr:hypothetical protein GQR58_027096 [Nymphon striatum]